MTECAREIRGMMTLASFREKFPEIYHSISVEQRDRIEEIPYSRFFVELDEKGDGCVHVVDLEAIITVRGMKFAKIARRQRSQL
ncbi:MAG: hypothetical protein NT157_05195 [Candidatus Micrarchaeota archaeon]|nr:hypothetical protein [Candidatus Micrarchaeota archaeon]